MKRARQSRAGRLRRQFAEQTRFMPFGFENGALCAHHAARGTPAAFVFKSINKELTPAEYKDILIKTSYPMHYKGIGDFEDDDVERVVNIGDAVHCIVDSDSK